MWCWVGGCRWVGIATACTCQSCAWCRHLVRVIAQTVQRPTSMFVRVRRITLQITDCCQGFYCLLEINWVTFVQSASTISWEVCMSLTRPQHLHTNLFNRFDHIPGCIGYYVIFLTVSSWLLGKPPYLIALRGIWLVYGNDDWHLVYFSIELFEKATFVCTRLSEGSGVWFHIPAPVPFTKKIRKVFSFWQRLPFRNLVIIL
jgi:hypothetical protein